MHFVHTCNTSENKLLKNFMAPFYGWSSSTLRLEPLWGGSLLFTTKFPEIPGTHFIDLGRMKGWVNLGATQWIWTRNPWIGNPESSAQKCWCLLRYLSFELFDHKKIPGLFQDFSKLSAKFEDFPGLFSNSTTFLDWWEPCIILCMCSKNYDKMMYGSWDMVHSGQADRRMNGRMEKFTYRGAPP